MQSVDLSSTINRNLYDKSLVRAITFLAFSARIHDDVLSVLHFRRPEMCGYWNFYVRRNPHILAKVLLDSEFMQLKEYCEDTEWCTLVEVLTYTYQCSLISKICICFTILATNFPAVLKHSTKYSNSKTPHSRPSSWWGTATNGFVATRRINAPSIASKWADVSHIVVVNICYASDSTTRSSNNDYQSLAAMISGLSCLCARTVAIWLSSALFTENFSL